MLYMTSWFRLAVNNEVCFCWVLYAWRFMAPIFCIFTLEMFLSIDTKYIISWLKTRPTHLHNLINIHVWLSNQLCWELHAVCSWSVAERQITETGTTTVISAVLCRCRQNSTVLCLCHVVQYVETSTVVYAWDPPGYATVLPHVWAVWDGLS